MQRSFANGLVFREHSVGGAQNVLRQECSLVLYWQLGKKVSLRETFYQTVLALRTKRLAMKHDYFRYNTEGITFKLTL